MLVADWLIAGLLAIAVILQIVDLAVNRDILKALLALLQRPARAIGQIQLGSKGMPTNFSVQAGGAPAVVQFIPLPSGSVFATPTSFTPSSSDPAVVIAPNPGDTTGTEFQLTVPATDTNTSFTLSVSGPDGAAGATISGSQSWTILPAAAPTFATSIGQQQLS